MNRIDSGNATTDTSASSKGTTPPTANTLRHPKAGMMAAATNPPAAAPSVKPQNMPLSSNARRRVGTHSESSVVALGVAAPRPRPVMKRRIVSMVSDEAYTVARLKMPNRATEATSTGLRPILSAIGPDISAPSARPTSEALSAGPNACFGTPHSLVSEGTTKPIAAVSKPSATMIRKHRTKTTAWYPLKRWPSMNSCTSSVADGALGCELMRGSPGG